MRCNSKNPDRCSLTAVGERPGRAEHRKITNGEDARQVRRALARGEQEIAAGASYDLNSVFEEADALLNVHQH